MNRLLRLAARAIRGGVANAGASLEIDHDDSAFLLRTHLPAARQRAAAAARAAASAIVGDIDFRCVAGMVVHANAVGQDAMFEDQAVSVPITAGGGGADIDAPALRPVAVVERRQ